MNVSVDEYLLFRRRQAYPQYVRMCLINGVDHRADLVFIEFVLEWRRPSPSQRNTREILSEPVGDHIECLLGRSQEEATTRFVVI